MLSVYSSQFKKMEQQGLVAQGKAAITAALIVSNETLAWLGGFLNAKKEQASHSANDKVNQ